MIDVKYYTQKSKTNEAKRACKREDIGYDKNNSSEKLGGI